MERRCRNCKNSHINKPDGKWCTKLCKNQDGFEPVELGEEEYKESFAAMVQGPGWVVMKSQEYAGYEWKGGEIAHFKGDGFSKNWFYVSRRCPRVASTLNSVRFVREGEPDVICDIFKSPGWLEKYCAEVVVYRPSYLLDEYCKSVKDVDITKSLVGAWTFDSIGIEPERNTSMYHVMVIRKDEKTGEVLEIVKDLGIVVAKNKQAAIAEGILACPKEIKDGATSVVLASSDGISGRINYS